MAEPFANGGKTNACMYELIADAAHSPLNREQVIEQLIRALRRQVQELAWRVAKPCMMRAPTAM